MKLLVMVLALVGCHASPPVGAPGMVIEPGSADQCTQQCAAMKLELDSVVVMANTIGCVCRRASPPGTTAAASAAGGMTALLIARAEEEKRAADTQQRADDEKRRQDDEKRRQDDAGRSQP